MRKIGGLIAIVLIALLAITGCDNNTVDNDRTEEWEEYLAMTATRPDTSWYDATESKFVLDTANEILGIGKLIDEGVDFSGKSITLKPGLYDFSKVSETNDGNPSFIGSGERDNIATSKAFNGKFDGGNSLIKGVNLSYPTGKTTTVTAPDQEVSTGVGFFGMVMGSPDNYAEVKNLVFQDCTLYSTSNTTGIAVGYAEFADISGIVVMNCRIEGPQGVGGIVGRLYNGGSVSNCRVVNTSVLATADAVDYESTTYTGNYNAGGIVGCASINKANYEAAGLASPKDVIVSENTVELDNDSKISASDKNAGGICGNAGSNAKFSDNTVKIPSKDCIEGNTAAAPICAAGSLDPNYSGTNTLHIGTETKSVTSKTTDTFTI